MARRSDGGIRTLANGRGSCLVRLVVLLVVLLAAGALAWMLFLPAVVTAQIRKRTGFEASVTGLSCNAFTGRLAVRGLVLSNPASFPIRDFVELREFSMETEVWSWLSDRPVIDRFTADVRKVTLVRRPDGKSNAEILQRALFGEERATTSGPAAGSAATPPRPWLIRRLVLRFDRLVIADYSGVKPVVQEHALGLDQRYENVTEAKQLLVPEVLRGLAAVDLGPTLGRLVPGELGRALGDKVRAGAAQGAEAFKEAGLQAADLLKGLREKLEESRKP
jgi:hypothetical protein